MKKFVTCVFVILCAGFLAAFSPSNIQRKSQQALVLLEKHLGAGHDVSEIIPKIQDVKKQGQSGDLQGANALLDEILRDFTALDQLNQNDNIRGPFINPQLVTISGYGGDAAEPFISKDNQYLFFNDYGSKGENRDLHWAKRKSQTVFMYQGRVKNVNSKKVDGVPSMDENGRFYYISTDNYNAKNKFATVYSGDFNLNTGAVENIRAHPELSRNKPGWLNMDIEISKNGNIMFGTHSYFTPDTKGPQKSYLFVAKKQRDGSFEFMKDSKNTLKNINTSQHIVYAPSAATSLKDIYFTRFILNNGRPAEMSSYMAQRSDVLEPFGKPRIIPALSGLIAEAPSITDEGNRMYFHRKNPDTGKFAIYMLEKNKNK